MAFASLKNINRASSDSLMVLMLSLLYVVMLKSLLKDEMLDCSDSIISKKDEIHVIIKICLSKGRKYCGEGESVDYQHNWLATRKKGLSDICVKCRLGSACAIRAC